MERVAPVWNYGAATQFFRLGQFSVRVGCFHYGPHSRDVLLTVIMLMESRIVLISTERQNTPGRSSKFQEWTRNVSILELIHRKIRTPAENALIWMAVRFEAEFAVFARWSELNLCIVCSLSGGLQGFVARCSFFLICSAAVVLQLIFRCLQVIQLCISSFFLFRMLRAIVAQRESCRWSS